MERNSILCTPCKEVIRSENYSKAEWVLRAKLVVDSLQGPEKRGYRRVGFGTGNLPITRLRRS